MFKPCSGSRSKLSRRLLMIVAVPSALLGVACGSGADVVSNVALPSRQSTGFVDGVDVSEAPGHQPAVATVALTPPQRDYLGALSDSGIRPSSQLRALSIGSSVCQARAAGQSEQEVRDYVAPMVRSDVADAHLATPAPAGALDGGALSNGTITSKAIDDYIRSAIQWLC